MEKFEKERDVSGPEAQNAYREATGGRGALAKKNDSLKAFLKDKCKIGEHLSKVIAEVALNKTFGGRYEWAPLKVMQEKHGDDLPKLVRCGAVAVRKNPKCPEVMQFRDDVEYGSTEVAKRKGFKAA